MFVHTVKHLASHMALPAAGASSMDYRDIVAITSFCKYVHVNILSNPVSSVCFFLQGINFQHIQWQKLYS